jgi:hypothetical protein
MFYIGEENYNINTRFKEQNVFTKQITAPTPFPFHYKMVGT